VNRNKEQKKENAEKQKQREQNIREHIKQKQERKVAKKGRLGFEGEAVRKPTTPTKKFEHSKSEDKSKRFNKSNHKEDKK